jgi:hypothetical protein
MQARIKAGAVVGQDHRFMTWIQSDVVFEVEKAGMHLYKCVAPGFGQLSGCNMYGGGAIYVRNLKDIVPVNGESNAQ